MFMKANFPGVDFLGTALKFRNLEIDSFVVACLCLP